MSACGGIHDIALNPVHWDLDPKEASSQAAAFFMNFRKRFVEAPIEEKKALVRQVVIGISVNPEEKTASFLMTKIPMVSHPVMTALLPSESTIKVVAGAVDALDRKNEFPFLEELLFIPILENLRA